MSLTFSIGSAVEFASFDGDGDFFRVHATLLKNKHAGVHEITITAKLPRTDDSL